ncbi:MAG: CotH kinase family protein [Eubacteriales bacterium]|nr:CotH kinase family protein [Eubacteriales bacterium]
MRKSKTIVLVMTLMLSLLAAAILFYQEQRANLPISVVLKSDGGVNERIKSLETGDGFYVFLPSGADLDQAKLVTGPLSSVRIDGKKVDSETVCGEFPLFEKLTISYRKWGKTCEKFVSFCQSEGVPALYIDTASGSMDYIHEQKGNGEAGSLRLYTHKGDLDCTAQISAINGRGNGTWTREKKPYSLELTQKEDILGMGAEKKWILLANAVDPTNINNKMCFDFASKVGCDYTPECRWVDLYLNGNYAGLYLISERNEVNEQRVNIPEEGSFLISKELSARWDGKNYSAFFTQHDFFYRIHHVGMDEGVMEEIWQSVEDAIFAEDGIDPRTGKSWDELIDVESWAKQYLIWDCFMDVDAATISKFFYYDPVSEQVFAGPLWDMDDIFSGIDGFSISILSSGRKYVWDWGKESMFYYLSQKDSFRETLFRLYVEEYRPLLLELAETGIDQYRQQIRTASILNDIRWDFHDADSLTEQRKCVLLERIRFLDEYLGNEADYCMVSLGMPYYQWRSFAVRRGETADFLITSGKTWLDYETGEPFDVTVPVTCDWVIYQAENENEEE